MYGSFFQSEKIHCSSIRTVISDLMLCRWSFASQFYQDLDVGIII